MTRLRRFGWTALAWAAAAAGAVVFLLVCVTAVSLPDGRFPGARELVLFAFFLVVMILLAMALSVPAACLLSSAPPVEYYQARLRGVLVGVLVILLAWAGVFAYAGFFEWLRSWYRGWTWPRPTELERVWPPFYYGAPGSAAVAAIAGALSGNIWRGAEPVRRGFFSRFAAPFLIGVVAAYMVLV